jgi:hypothetical protein
MGASVGPAVENGRAWGRGHDEWMMTRGDGRWGGAAEEAVRMVGRGRRRLGLAGNLGGDRPAPLKTAGVGERGRLVGRGQLAGLGGLLGAGGVDGGEGK